MKDKYAWWKHGVVYHLYVRSFFDSNNDGIGDIRGIINKFAYLKDLGVDAIWLSPILKSPQKDFGYDIQDFQAIEPDYGKIDDFLELLYLAHSFGIKIIMDMVLNHTSDKHPWFIESRSSKTNPKRDWFIWKKAGERKLPNNWKTSFGGRAWCYDEQTQEYYYHTFFKEQPDLNWRNKDVKKVMFEQMQYWLDIGVDGFRLDVINCIGKDKKFRNNPMLIMQFINKKKVFNRNRKNSISIVKDLRKLLDNYNEKVSIGEIYALPPGDSMLVNKYLGDGKDALHLALDFSLMFARWNPVKYANILQKAYDSIPPNGWMCTTMSNHDVLRNISKHTFHKNEKAKLMAILLLTTYGTPFIYYGEEIGLESMPITRKSIRDSIGKSFWPIYKGRDNLRTPMQWDSSSFAGFSKAIPWLPVNRNFAAVNVSNQTNNSNSLLSLFKELIKLRKEHFELQAGDWQLIDVGNKQVLSYQRKFENTSMQVFLNFSRRSQNIIAPNSSIIYSTHKFNKYEVLQPFEGRICSC